MSTVAYAQLTNARDLAPQGTSTTTKPGVQTYMDAFAALVPAEVLTLHALIISATTKIDEGKTTIMPTNIATLYWSFWGLIALSLALFAVPRYTGGRWDKFDWIRVAIAPLAFVGWTMLQRTTAFDAVFPTLDQGSRTVIALFLGAVLGAVTAGLAVKVDSKPAPNQ